MTDDRYYVTFTSETGHSVRVLMDAASPTLTDGFGGWETVDRPKRVGMTRWKGKAPFAQDVAILFDGAGSQEDDISTLILMSQPVSNMQPPPKIAVTGAVEHSDLSWVISNLRFATDGVIRDFIGGTSVRTRQPVVVSLLEFVDDHVIVTRSSPAVVARANVAPAKHITVPKTTTLNDLAIKYFQDPSQWQNIWLYNSFLVMDPRAIIPHGTTVTIPGKTIITV